MGEGEKYEEEIYTSPSKVLQFINYISCRGDLVREKLTCRPVTFKELFRYAVPADFALLALGTLGSIISGLCHPMVAVMIGLITNVLLNTPADSEDFQSTSVKYTILYFALFATSAFANFFQFACFQRVCIRLIARIRHEYVRAILRQEAAWLDSNSCGVLTTQLNDNIERIRDGICDKVGLLLRGATMIVAAVGISFWHDWRIALAVFPAVPLASLCMNIMNKKLEFASAKEFSEVAKAGSVAEEAIFGVKTVQACNGQSEMVFRYKRELTKGAKHAMTKSKWSGFLGGMLYVVFYIFQGAGLLLGARLLQIGLATDAGGTLIAVTSTLVAGHYLGLIAPQLMAILSARVAASIIFHTIDRTPLVSNMENAKKLSAVEGKVTFHNVHFRYPTRKDVKVLNGFTLDIEKGETVALVGPSGCGKTTTVGLLTRLYEAETGQVLIDGVSVKEIAVANLREIVGIVEQNASLFSATVKENICMGREDIEEEQIEQVARMANAHDFIMQLPQGYDTLIGDGGVQLSGGQKQRIAIARVLARNPKILLLDEATSALDVHSEAVVQEALDRASAGRTTIVIAHRLATVVNADLIVVLDKGRVVEKGSHTKLVAAGGKYAELAKAQAMLKTEEKKKEAPAESGAEAFVRATKRGDSFRKSSTRLGNGIVAESICEEDVEVEEAPPGFHFRSLFASIAPHKWLCISAVFVSILVGLEVPVQSVIYGQIYAALSHLHSDTDEMMRILVRCSFGMMGVGLHYLITYAIAAYLFGKLAERLIVDLRCRTFNNLLHQDAAFFDAPENAPGKVITRLASDAPNVKAVFDARMMQMIAYVSAWFWATALTFFTCWPMGILILVLCFGLGLFITFLSKTINKRNIQQQLHDPSGKIAVELFENARTIQLSNSESYFYKKYETASKEVKATEVKNGYLEATNFAFSQSYDFFCMGAAFALGCWLLYSNLATAHIIYQGIIATSLSCLTAVLLTTFYSDFARARTAAALMFRLMSRPSATGDVFKGEKKVLSGQISLEKLTFAYPQRPQHLVMRGLSLDIKRGTTVAFVGPSGSGKSTIISLLERFYDSTRGVVRLDDANLPDLSLHCVRTQMALVGQEPRLFAGSIRENVAFGMGIISEENIREALRDANAETFVMALPQGLETDVGEKGTQLSGGQKQRIAIARALVRKPAILLLDEATSSLDSQSERAVQEALDKAKEGRTCVVVAHRLSSIQNADEILFLDDGCIREHGNHGELMKRRGRYYDLVKKQDTNEEDS